MDFLDVLGEKSVVKFCWFSFSTMDGGFVATFGCVCDIWLTKRDIRDIIHLEPIFLQFTLDSTLITIPIY